MADGGRRKVPMDDQLKILFEYTRWHLGMYTGLAAVVGLYFTSESIQERFHLGPCAGAFSAMAVVLLFFAGLTGGVVASSIPEHRSYRRFVSPENLLGPWTLRLWRPRFLMGVEHTCFWVACAFLVVAGFSLLAGV